MGANEVFVEKVNGKPYRKYIFNLCRLDNRRRASTLFVAFFSCWNASPYKYCLTRIFQNFNNRVPIIVSFFKCQSISNFKKGVYTNCLYYIKGGNYIFNKDSYIPAIKAAAALLNYKFKGTL